MWNQDFHFWLIEDKEKEISGFSNRKGFVKSFACKGYFFPFLTFSIQEAEKKRFRCKKCQFWFLFFSFLWLSVKLTVPFLIPIFFLSLFFSIVKQFWFKKRESFETFISGFFCTYVGKSETLTNFTNVKI